ncbi:hypothetical protein N7922_13855 [Kosakonia sp. ML.JS2a]|uniref:hypothetical protein n=1 Tax=Kosakonia sp. ML.JS2a TaxID=2980557 RepID=UPI0021D96108|nr:hypothetical protein [Kosakonia sp. ML.JS2a]UXY08976.1 hypothetical protein N7922_13855 [Kosakonia sp. ML.JS2a]
MERKIIKPAPDLFVTVGTINRADIATRGIFSKGRAHVLDKLILCPVSRYFIRKFYAFGLRLGKFLYGGSMGFLKYVDLLSNESDALSKDFVTLNGRERTKPALKGRNK